jgi:putative oxidoreductase
MLNVAFLVGRLVFGGYFLYSGLNHFMMRKMMAGYAASKGVPAPDAAVLGSGLLLVLGGLSIVLGIRPHVGAGLIVVFLLGVTPMMHNFWAVTDPGQKMGDMINFTKNLALIGAALMTVAVPWPWPYALG